MPLFASLLAVATLGQPKIVEVPFKRAEDAIIVDATVNGRPVSLMFDTGFSGTVVLDSAINVGKPSGTMNLRDFVGTFEAATVPIKTLSIGSKAIKVEDMKVVQQPMADMSQNYGVTCNGILGFEPVKNGVMEINFEKNKFIFHPATVDITKRKPDNKRTFLAKLLPLGTDSMEMEVTAKNGKKMILALDTGNAFYATTHKDVLERVGLWDAGRKPKFMKLSGVASGPVESFYKRMDGVNIYGVPVEKSVWSVIDRPSSDAEGDGTIGFGFLKNFNIVIDYDRRRVWLENFTGVVGSEEPASVGISAGTDSKLKRVLIYRVAPESPADKAGIKAGDHILSVEGTDLMGNYDFRRMEKLLEGEKDSKAKVVTSRNGQLFRHELTRVPMVNE